MTPSTHLATIAVAWDTGSSRADAILSAAASVVDAAAVTKLLGSIRADASRRLSLSEPYGKPIGVKPPKPSAQSHGPRRARGGAGGRHPSCVA